MIDLKKIFIILIATLFIKKFIFAEEEIHFVNTADGKKLALTRYKPANLIPKREPLILCHGLCVNRLTLDLMEGHSLAAYLCDLNFDVWLLDNRGAGRSYKPEWYNPWGYNWQTDDLIHYDLPSAIDYVINQTGFEQVFWIGHSNGGMIMYAYLETESPEKIKGMVSIASAGTCGNSSFWNEFIKLFGEYVDYYPVIYVQALMEAIAPYGGVMDTPLARTLWNHENMTPEIITRLFEVGWENLCTKVAKNYLDWLANDEFRSGDLNYSYKQNLDKITTPMLVLVGSGDELAMTDNVIYAYDHISSPDKTLILLSKENSFCDYGHFDIVIGIHAQQEVYPLIADWINRRDGDNSVVVQIVYPQEGQILADQNIIISGTAYDRDGAGIERVLVSTDNGWNYNQANGDEHWNYLWSHPANGIYTIVALAEAKYSGILSPPHKVSVVVSNSSYTPMPTPTLTATPSLTPAQTYSPSPTFTPYPIILVAGYWDTDLNSQNGGSLKIIALPASIDELQLELYYQQIATGIILKDNGTDGDIYAGDGVYSFCIHLPPNIPESVFLLELGVNKGYSESLLWPFLKVNW